MHAKLIVIIACLAAGPALAQDDFSLSRSIELRAEQDMARQRLNALQNEVFAAETRLRTEQTLRDVEARREPLRVRPATTGAVASTEMQRTSPSIGGYAQIPDRALADSEARVRAVGSSR